MKAEKPVGSSLFGQAKKEQPASTGATAPKAPASKSSSKPAPKKAATPKTQEPKKKVYIFM